jgi:hypothetical protein
MLINYFPFFNLTYEGGSSFTVPDLETKVQATSDNLVSRHRHYQDLTDVVQQYQGLLILAINTYWVLDLGSREDA